MTENRNSSQGLCSSGRDTICIDTMRVLDSCRDRDCYEDLRVCLTSEGQKIINSCVSVRVKEAEILWAFVGVNPIAFNDGFYHINIRYYIKLTMEACICPGKSQEFTGLVTIDKSVVLYGGKGNVSIFKSNPDNDSVCPSYDPDYASNNLPIGVVETVEPIVLSNKIKPLNCYCGNTCCPSCDIPRNVLLAFDNDLTDPTDGNVLLVTIGIFSIVRIERPAQYLISASDYSVPDKECCGSTEDPCSLFRNMSFPIGEFTNGERREGHNLQCQNNNTGGCGCRKN